MYRICVTYDQFPILRVAGSKPCSNSRAVRTPTPAALSQRRWYNESRLEEQQEKKGFRELKHTVEDSNTMPRPEVTCCGSIVQTLPSSGLRSALALANIEPKQTQKQNFDSDGTRTHNPYQIPGQKDHRKVIPYH